MDEQEQSVDMILVLSSEIVCQMAEVHFNTKMFRSGSKVKVIDLKATEGGLVQFNVEFMKEPPKKPDPDYTRMTVEEMEQALDGQGEEVKQEPKIEDYPVDYDRVMSEHHLTPNGQAAHPEYEVKNGSRELDEAINEFVEAKYGQRDEKGRFTKVK